MARFIGRVKGQSKNEVTRLGSTISGIVVEADGWNLGVRVRGYVNENGEDAFMISITGGSNDTDVLKQLIFSRAILKLQEIIDS